MDAEVIVVGAGISGLSAAKWLKDSGVNVLVLEATNRVGGRTFTKRNPNVNYVDLGGAYTASTQDHLLRLSKELGLETYNVNQELKSVYYRNGRRLIHDATVFPYERNPFVNMDLNNILRLIDKMGQEIPVDSPWNAPHAEEWDLMSVKDFIQKICWTKRASDICKEMFGLFISSEAYETSLLMFLWFVKQCGGFKRMLSSQERKFHGGSQQISEKIAEKLGDSVVLKNCPVVSINQESKDLVLVKTLSGKEYKTKYVILACPPALQQKIHFIPPLPPMRNQLIERAPMGAVTKVVLFYTTPFWKEKGLSGSHLIVGGAEHPIFFAMDDTKPDGSFPAIVGYISGDKCRKMSQMTAEDRKNAIVLSLQKASGCSEATKPIHYEEKSWMDEHYVCGCSSIFPPGFLTRYGRFLRTPIDRLYFAGTETSIIWSGYMNGAVEAGERAARETLCAMGKITADQIWVKEPDFEGVPALPFGDTFGEKYTPPVPGFLKFVTFTSILGAATFVFLKYRKYFQK